MEYARTSNLSAVAVYLAMLLGAQAAQIGKFHNLHVLYMNASAFGGFAPLQQHAVSQRDGKVHLSNDGTLT
jgi:DNA-binding transcriptional regulator YbjK